MSTTTTTVATCGVCAKTHRAGSAIGLEHAAALAAVTGKTNPAAAARGLPSVVVTAEDVATALGSKLGALVLCPWGGVMGVAMPYVGQEVIVPAADVYRWFVRCNRLVAETAKALSADLAWTAVPDLVAAA